MALLNMVNSGISQTCCRMSAMRRYSDVDNCGKKSRNLPVRNIALPCRTWVSLNLEGHISAAVATGKKALYADKDRANSIDCR